MNNRLTCEYIVITEFLQQCIEIIISIRLYIIYNIIIYIIYKILLYDIITYINIIYISNM